MQREKEAQLGDASRNGPSSGEKPDGPQPAGEAPQGEKPQLVKLAPKKKDAIKPRFSRKDLYVDVSWLRVGLLGALTFLGLASLYLASVGTVPEASSWEVESLQRLFSYPVSLWHRREYLPPSWALVLAFAAIGALVAKTCRWVAFLGSLALFTAVLAIAATQEIFLSGEPIPWVACSMALLGSAGVVRLERGRLALQRRRRLLLSFDGLVTPERLKEVLDHASSLVLEPTSSVVTMLYVRLLGVGACAEREAPRKAFANLRDELHWIRQTIHAFHGYVARIDGDGMLCLFGYPYDGTRGTRNHADEALRCALDLVKRTVDRALSPAREAGTGVYPLRIGIHTTSAYIGDLDLSHRVEMALVGSGVQMSQQLESSCDSFGILLTPSTHDILMDLDHFRPMFRKRLVQIDRGEELVEVYACLLPDEYTDRLRQAQTAYQKFAGLERKETRWSIPGGVNIRVITPSGKGKLLNFSENGIGVLLDHYLGTGARVRLEIDNEGEDLGPVLKRNGVLPLLCEVRWSHPNGRRGYDHGLLIKNLNTEQKKLLLDELRCCLNYTEPFKKNREAA